MFLRPFSALTLVCAAFVCAPTVRAQAAPEVASKSAEPEEVRAWLMRIHAAASHHNFQGTFVVSGGGSVSSARIAHYCEGANQYERIESLDGQARHVFRHNDVVQTVWPGAQLARVEQRELVMSFPALLQAGGDHIVDFYDVLRQGSDRVAGHEANVLLVKPRDAFRFGYRLWADKASGLLLRADVLGERSELLETSAFSEVSIGVKAQPESVLAPMKKLDGYRVLRPVLTPTRMEAEGWTLREPVPGFRQVSCVRRPIDGVGPGEIETSSPQVLQTIYSDGLTYVSVFIEPFVAQRHTRPMIATVGATQTLMRKQGEWWVTVVGDVPAATLRQFANGLERKK
jgi:sigma-E factor negative regulatory protein RseB